MACFRILIVLVTCAVLQNRCVVLGEYMNGFRPVADLSSSAIEDTDDASFELQLGTPFPFYNKRYSSIFINEDGILTFLNPVATKGPISIPVFDTDGSGVIDLPQEEMVLIAPFWSEVFPSSTGKVYYSSGLSSSTLQSAENIVKGCYIDQNWFSATAGIVVTWDQVSNDDEAKKNSFQAILVYDDFRSFVIFYYSDMQYQSTSVPNVGFNAGDIKGGLALTEGSFGALPSGTNCGEASETPSGAYVFRVDVERMTSAGCPGDTQNIALQVAPSSGPMFGGNRITVMHGCDLNSKEPVCVFKQGDVILQTVTNVETIDSAVYCIPGPFFVTGDVTLLVYKSLEQAEADPAQNPFITAKYTVEHPDDSELGVTRSSSESASWNSAGSSLIITWDPALFMDDLLVTVSILQYDESASGEVPTWELAYNLGVNEPNSGSFSFIPMALDNVTEDNPFGIIRVMGVDEYPVSLFSDVHMLGYLLHQPYQDNPAVWADEQCTRWDAKEDVDNDNAGQPRYYRDVPPCPCNLDQVELDPGRFMEQTSGCSRFAGDPSCTREMSSARRCFLSTKSLAGAECCYALEGNLVFAMDDRTGGSSDKAPMLGKAPYALPGQTPYLSHWVTDVVPYQLCCRWATDRCRTYLENRPGKDCYDYSAQQSAFVFGDPHFVTFDQRRYTFNGIGEYRLMEVASLGFRLQGRTTSATEQGRDPDFFSVASFLSAVAMQETGSDIIHVEVSELRPLNLFYVGADGSFRQPDLWMDGTIYHPLHLRGVTVYVNPTFGEIMVSFHTSLININIKAETLTPSITVQVMADKTELGTAAVTGLMGDMDGDPLNDIRTTDGTIYEGDDPTELFELFKTWEATTPDIFHRDGVSKARDYRNTTFVPTLVTPGSETLPPSIGSGLEGTCQGLQECIFDMSVTQTTTAGEAAYAANAEYVERALLLAKVETCRYIPAPEGGQVTFSDENKHYVVGTSITFSCDDATNILSGPATRKCQSNRQWSNSKIPGCIDTDCDRETLSAEGVEVVKEGVDSEGNTQVTIGCPGTNVTSTLICRDGVWDGAKISCSVGGLAGGAVAGIVVALFIILALIVIGVGYVLFRRKEGVKDLGQSGTQVKENQPAENWGMEQEAADASAAHASTKPKYDSDV